MNEDLQNEWLKVPLSARQLHVLQHSLGVDKYGQGNQYRNHFVTGMGSDDWPICIGLCALGLMQDHGVNALAGGDHCFTVTERGKLEMAKQSENPPKLTRSQKRYRKFLEADSGMKFGEWLKQNMENYSNEVR